MTGIKSGEYKKILSRLFAAIDLDHDGVITKHDLIKPIAASGMQSDDPRITGLFAELTKYSDEQHIERKEFLVLGKDYVSVLQKILQGDLIISKFNNFCQEIDKLYNKFSHVKSGKVADYIPQLKKINPNYFAVAICTIDGQQFFLGDYDEPFCMQSTCKPILYCLALEEHGEQEVHRHIGREPSGVSFNAITLNERGLPHNPMINAGAIASCSLIKPGLSSADKFEYVIKAIEQLIGNKKVGFNNSVYLSEKTTADRNFALGYFMRENKVFPSKTNLMKLLEYYFQCCSIDINARDMAVMAASLANAGICPLTNKKIFNSENVKHCLSLMYSCGLYDYSGEWSFLVGIPAKSGVSGAIMAVIPGLMGICTWSPPIDKQGNSVRGIEFFKELVSIYDFHSYDRLIKMSQRIDPQLKHREKEINTNLALLSAASIGDLSEMMHLTARGIDLNSSDYDGRTALHLAASEGHTAVVEYLIKKGVKLNPVDRWGGTPLRDAEREHHKQIVNILRKATSKRGGEKKST